MFFSLICCNFDSRIYQPATSGNLVFDFGVFFFSSICGYHLHLMLFYKLKKEKEKEKSSINLIKPNTPLMNKTLNEPQDLMKNAQTGHGIAED